MRLSRKQPALIIISSIALLSIWYVDMKLKDQKSFLFQLRELTFPTKYSQGQAQNFQADLGQAGVQRRHEILGREAMRAGRYDDAILEYQKAIELAQQDPRDWAQIDNQKFPRGALIKVYERAGRFNEAIEQIDWLLAHSPSEPYKLKLLAWKDVLTAESVGQYEEALETINEFLKSAEELNEYRRTKDKKGWVHPDFVLEEFRAKRQEIQHRLNDFHPDAKAEAL